MSTWAELRKNALTLLDITSSATTSSEMRVAVDLRMKQSRDRLYNLRVPESLLTISSALSIDSTTTAISIPNATAGTVFGFSLSTVRRPIALVVEDETWKFVDYSTWVLQNSAVAGNQRWQRSWTLYQKNTIYLKTVPATGETWDVQLLYMAEPATISDVGEPEIGDEWEELLVCDVVRGFPNRFISEERLSLLAQIEKRYSELLMLYKSQPYVGAYAFRLMPFVRDTTTRSLVNWGTGDL